VSRTIQKEILKARSVMKKKTFQKTGSRRLTITEKGRECGKGKRNQKWWKKTGGQK
jgi:hypothetical protein